MLFLEKNTFQKYEHKGQRASFGSASFWKNGQAKEVQKSEKGKERKEGEKGEDGMDPSNQRGA